MSLRDNRPIMPRPVLPIKARGPDAPSVAGRLAGQAAGPGEQPLAPPNPPRLLDRLREALRVRHYALRTEQAYVDWARRYILFHGKRHPESLGAEARQSAGRVNSSSRAGAFTVSTERA